MGNSIRLATKFEQAINKEVIKPGTERLYIWEMPRNPNGEAEIRWIIAEGYFFKFYQGKAKELIFADSIYQRRYDFPVSTFINFDKTKDQIVFIDDNVIDITGEYLKDSLKSFTPERATKLLNASKIRYDQKLLLITNNDFDKFLTEGFYQRENEIRWTNGNASIEFLGDYNAQDSLHIELTTYIPPICKDILPRVSIVDNTGKEYQSVVSSREGDKFRYTFFLYPPVVIQKIKLLAGTIYAPSDKRVLSFPFISLQLKQ